jgi:hypothetical protein
VALGLCVPLSAALGLSAAAYAALALRASAGRRGAPAGGPRSFTGGQDAEVRTFRRNLPAL